MVVALTSDAIGSGNTMYVHYSAGENGGVLIVSDNFAIFWSGDSVLTSSTTKYDGSLLVESSQVIRSGTTTFTNNSPQDGGGGAVNGR